MAGNSAPLIYREKEDIVYIEMNRPEKKNKDCQSVLRTRRKPVSTKSDKTR